MKLIKHSGPTQKLVTTEEVMIGLGAEKIETNYIPGKSPISIFALRQFMAEHLHSTGGRPTLDIKASDRKKIALIKGDWDKIKQIAKKEKAAPGQLVAVLLHKILDNINLCDHLA